MFMGIGLTSLADSTDGYNTTALGLMVGIGLFALYGVLSGLTREQHERTTSNGRRI